MNRNRRLLMVACVATALMADRMAASAPTRPQVTQSARRLATRLVVSLRQTVPAARVQLERIESPQRKTPARWIPDDALLARCCELSPVQYPLPPPTA